MDSQNLCNILDILEKWKVEANRPVVECVKEEYNDPFYIIVATILSLRTRDETTRKAFENLRKKIKDVHQLREIGVKELEKLIYPVGFYKNKAKTLKEIANVLIEKFNGKVPSDMEKLLSIKGVGRKTANLVLIEGFDKEGICVDTHVHRILNLWGYVKTKSPDETEMVLREKLPKKYWKRINAILVTFGQNICKPVSLKCNICPVYEYCTYKKKKKRVDGKESLG